MDAEQASHVLATTAGLGTGSDGTAECASRRQACVGRSSRPGLAQLDQALQQGGRPGPSAGQLVDTGVLLRAGEVGRQREGMAQLEFRNESLCRNHRSSFVGGHDDFRM